MPVRGGHPLQEEFKVLVRVEPVRFGGLYNAVHGGARVRAIGRVAEQPVFPAHDRGTNRILRVVVGHWDSAVEKEGAQRLLLICRVSDRLGAGIAFQAILACAPAPEFIQDRGTPFLALIEPLVGRQIAKFALQHEQRLHKIKALFQAGSLFRDFASRRL